MAIDKDKVLELFGRYWEIAYNEGRTGEGFPDLANDVLAELRDVLDADDGDVFTGQLVEIDGHVYGLRPGAARVVREALRDAGRYRWLANEMLACDYGDNDQKQVGWIMAEWRHKTNRFIPHDQLRRIFGDSINEAIDAAMAKDGA